MIYLVLCGVFGTVGVLPIERIVKLAGLVLMVVVLFVIFLYISRRQFDKRRRTTDDGRPS